MSSLREAAAKTGVDFNFLVAQASLESGFKGSVQANHSSAAGLFQFTNGTWLQMMRDHGGKYGYGELAKQVKAASGGGLAVASAAAEKQILDLRRNVKLSALFAAEYAKMNATQLEAAVGHKASAAELHLAHLLGPNGAIRFLKAHEDNSSQPAAKVLPQAARQNPGLFYAHGSRSAQSVAAVYRKIQERFDRPWKQVEALEAEPLRPALGISVDDVVARRTDRRA
jgi:hypothetical protein